MAVLSTTGFLTYQQTPHATEQCLHSHDSSGRRIIRSFLCCRQTTFVITRRRRQACFPARCIHTYTAVGTAVIRPVNVISYRSRCHQFGIVSVSAVMMLLRYLLSPLTFSDSYFSYIQLFTLGVLSI